MKGGSMVLYSAFGLACGSAWMMALSWDFGLAVRTAVCLVSEKACCWV